jgi:23S rRNA-intervening sequence protein
MADRVGWIWITSVWIYHLALDFLVLASEIIEGLPRDRSHLSDQFSRASLSIVLNLAEGAGKHLKSRNPMESHFPPSGHGHGHGHAYRTT